MENWKTIPEFDRYSVSDYGRVMNNQTGQVISQRLSRNGYLRVNLRKGDVEYEKPTVIHVHRMVGLCFVDNPLKKPQLNHIDGDKKNNHVSNLEWVTSSENINHAYDNDLISKVRVPMNEQRRINNVESHLRPGYREKMQIINKESGLTKTIIQIDQETGIALNEFDNAHDAARSIFGDESKFKDRLIARAARGVVKSAYGFMWRYA